jgi:hypothetical protein
MMKTLSEGRHLKESREGINLDKKETFEEG